MAQNLKLQAELKLKVEDFQKNLQSAKKKIETLGTGFKNTAKVSTTALGTITAGVAALKTSLGPLMAVFVAVKATADSFSFLGESIRISMDAVESENLFAVSMGNMAESARKWSDQTSRALGLNAIQVRKNLGMFNVMLNSMGSGEQKAYGMAKGLTQLAYDMASFYNMSPEEAFIKLKAGITGEVEPLKALGIVVNENTTATAALTLGIKKKYAAMTEAEKIEARYASIMRQTSKAQGDLARTLNSPANRMRVLGERFIYLKKTVGDLFISIIPGIASGLTQLVNTLIELFQNPLILKTLQLITYTLGKMFEMTSGLLLALNELVISLIGGFIEGVLKITGAITEGSQKNKKGINVIIAAIAALLAGIKIAKDIILVIIQLILQTFNRTVNSIVQSINNIKKAWSDFVNWIISTKDNLINAVKNAFESFGISISPALQWLDQLYKAIIKIIGAIFGLKFSLQDLGKMSMGIAGGAVGGGAGTLLGSLIPIPGAAAALGGILGHYGRKAGTGLSNAGTSFQKEFQKIIDEINSLSNSTGSMTPNIPNAVNSPAAQTAKNTKDIKNKLDDLYKRIVANNFIKSMEDAFKNRSQLADRLYSISNTGNAISNRITSMPIVEPIQHWTFILPTGHSISIEGKASSMPQRTIDLEKKLGGIKLPKPIVTGG